MKKPKLQEFRSENGLTQKELVDILREHGFFCTQGFLSHVEIGRRKPSIEMLVSFKESFPDELIDKWFFE